MATLMYSDVLASVESSSAEPVALLTHSVLYGCNLYHGNTVCRQEVSMGGLSGRYSREAGADFPARFKQRFIAGSRRIPNSRNEAFLERLHSTTGVSFDEVVLEAILCIEAALGFVMHDFRPIAMANVVAAESPRHVLLVWETHAPKISRAAARVALAGLTELLPDSLHSTAHGENEDFETQFAALKERVRRRQFTTTTTVILLAARQRGIPCETAGGPHLYLGQGSAQKVLYSSIPGDVSHSATVLCRNKWKATRRLAQLHLPVPLQMRVGSVEQSQAAAEKMGYPVVVKPLKGKQAIGVSVGVNDSAELAFAFRRAHRKGSDVIVERIVPGNTYRLLVIGGRFVAAVKIVPPRVTGDGKRTITELIDALNSDPLRDDVNLYRIIVDDELTSSLARNGYALGDVLEKGREVALRSAANVAVGGVHTDITDVVHPDNREMAIKAAAGVGLTVAGIDFVTRDITRSYLEVGGGIVEMNARPGLYMHVFPRCGFSRDVAGALLELSFPHGATGRIPTAMIVGDRHTGAITRELEALVHASGRITGLVTKQGVYIDGKPEHFGKVQQRKAIEAVIRDSRSEVLVSALSPRRVVDGGLVLDRIDVAAIMAPTANQSAEEYRQALTVLVKAARGMVVAGADNPSVLEMLDQLDANKLMLVSPHLDHPVIDGHLERGGIALTKVEEHGRALIAIRRKGEIRVIANIAHGEERARSSNALEKRMYALALAYGLGIDQGMG